MEDVMAIESKQDSTPLPPGTTADTDFARRKERMHPMLETSVCDRDYNLSEESYNWSNDGKRRHARLHVGPAACSFFEEGSFYLLLRYSVSHERSQHATKSHVT